MSFQNLPITIKIICLLVLLSALTGAGALYAGMKMNTIDAAYSDLLARASRGPAELMRVNRHSFALQTAIYRNIAVETAAEKAKAREEEKDVIKRLNDLMDAAIEHVPTQADAFRALKVQFDQTIDKTCAETIRLANVATDRETQLKAQVHMINECERELKVASLNLGKLNDQVVADFDHKSDLLTIETNNTIFTNYAIVIVGTIFCLSLAIVIIIMLITGPLKRLINIMTDMSAGKLDAVISGTTRRDELGLMSRTLEQFRISLSEADRFRQEAGEMERRASETRRSDRLRIADQFQAKMGKLATAFVESSKEVSESARNLSETAEETKRQAQSVSGAAEDASANVQTVASATEEMSASIRSISDQVAKSTLVANTAAAEANRTESDVRALSEAATKIGEVVELINTIAGQTNLLALNATIEAARAGEAGRGFAVVASEVKQLAAQTARATDEIGSKIAEIQSATNRTVTSIEKIVGTVAEIQQISNVIGHSVKEQGEATTEISANTQRAARGTTTVTNSITEVGRATEMTGSAATQLMGLSGTLNTQASDLQAEVAAFVHQLRAG